MNKYLAKPCTFAVGCVVAILSGLTIITPPAHTQTETETQPELRPAVQTASDRLLLLSILESTLITVNNANLSGNYSVLRELAAPRFQANFEEADIAEFFESLRRRNPDIMVITQLEPIFTTQPTLDAQGVLRMRGYYQTNPNTVFDLAYEFVNGRYLLAALYVDILPAEENNE